MDRFNTFKLFIQNNRNKIIVTIIIICIMFVSTIMFLNIDRKIKVETKNKVFSNLNLAQNEEEIPTNEEKEEYYYVDIKGQVNSPGVYSLEKGKRVIDAINIAGGLTDNADTTLINQSIKLTDQMVIIIYSKDEINNVEFLKETIEKQEDVCNNKEVVNDACICNNIETVAVPNLETKKDDNKIVAEQNNAKLEKNLININTATTSLLMNLPKIGEVKAKAIIAYRDTNGKFNSIEEIKQVKGIGESLFEQIKDYITI